VLVRLAGRTVAITGAAGGIGRALATRCAAEGARVAVSDQEPDGLDGDFALTADVTDAEQVERFIDEAQAALGPIEVFFANAGVAVGTDPIETEAAVWQLALDVNVLAHVAAARALLPHWLERGEGYFVATASAAGLLTQIGSAPYAVSKHAALAFAEWLSVTYGDRGIRVSCLCPMGVRTKMLEAGEDGAIGTAGIRAVTQAGAVLEPDDVADAVIEAIDEERFLVLPHPEVLTFFQRKASDYERWLAGMRRYQASLQA
jgi:NAD(P)-dependent dehydrogenase (short-subunit alcohol dehydrogenase family)